ncbi:MAG: PP2C family serine/threonine-protein phosphatase [Chloroflexota bacterium]
MDMFRRLFGMSGDEPEDPNVVTQPSASAEVKSAISAEAAQTAPMDDPDQPDGDSGEDEPTVPFGNLQTAPMDDAPSVMDGATRKLPLETVIASRNAHLQYGQSTDVGMVRTNNQDAMLAFSFSNRSVDDRPDVGLFIVADGMGGHHDGEKASAIVTRTVARRVIEDILLPIMSGGNDDNDRPPLTEALIEAIQAANSSVIADVPDGGTTITAVAVVGDLAYFAHVGDSRAYLITRDGMEQVTRDHSLVQRLIELDQLTPEEALDHPQQNVLYRAIGQSDSLEVDALMRRLPPNSSLLLCSDGLWGLVDEDVIEQTVRENPIPQEACDRLVALANTRGGKDNITAVMLHIPS